MELLQLPSFKSGKLPVVVPHFFNIHGQIRDVKFRKSQLFGVDPASVGWTWNEPEASGLLDQGAEIETRHAASQGTSLHYSAFGGHVGTMKMLLDRGANIEAKGMNNLTPLHLTAGEGHVHAARLLLDRRANIEAKDVDQDTPLHLACRFGHMEVITLLVELIFISKVLISVASRDMTRDPIKFDALNTKFDTLNILWAPRLVT